MNIFHKITLANLKKNRTRTLVTIIGIILSTAMFTAVTSCVSSLQAFMLEYSVYNHGSWHGAAHHMTQQEAEEFTGLQEIDQYVILRSLGYAGLPESKNFYKPYLFLCGVDDSVTDLLPIHILEGRMPQNDRELLLPEHLATNGLVDYELGDTLTLEVGTRVDNEGYQYDNNTPLIVQDSTEPADTYGSEASDAPALAEHIEDTATRTYQVVGFYERPVFEDYSAPGYTALTYAPDAACTFQDVYVTTDFTTDIQDFLADNTPSSFSVNYNYLRLQGASGESSFNRVLYSLSAILIAIIVFGSISLIYNAFSISISERTKQFGLLSSIGATRRQLIRSVLFEAAFLCIIGIPLGIASGLIGIGITLHFTGQTISDIFAGTTVITLTLHPSIGAIVIAILLAFGTVLLSAFLPAKRAMKLSAIDAIRQTADVSIRPGRVRTSRLTEKVFGFEGMLASKNYKRSRKRYRATVISLFLSVVLFIPASSFSAYLTTSVSSFYKDSEYDISVSLSENKDIDAFTELLDSIPEITQYGYSAIKDMEFTVSDAYLSDAYQEQKRILSQDAPEEAPADETPIYTGIITFVPDDMFRSYLKDNGLNPEDYFDEAAPRAILSDQLHHYNYVTEKYYDFSMLEDPTEADVQLVFSEYTASGNDYSHEPELIPVTIGSVLTKLPYGVTSYDQSIQLLYPYSMADPLLASLDAGKDYDLLSGLPLSENIAPSFMMRCSDHKAAYEKLQDQMEEQDIPGYVYDYAENAEESRAMLTVVNIFSYGFIILISLIAVANIFNTISTNINLRRREFAMLKSVGLSPRGMRRMMQFECLLYGFRGLLYGLPVSIFVTWLIYRAVSEGLELSFFVPWYSVAIAVGSVFLVVAVTMVYSMRRLNRENTVDALKNENL